jgi:hypothetical protein
MIIQCKANNLWTNIDNIRNAKIETLIPVSGIPLVLLINIRDNQSKQTQNLKKISTAFGREVEFQVEWENVFNQIKDASYRVRLGEILLDSYLSNVATL